MYDAEDVIRNMMRDSIHWSARKEWDYTLADYHIRKGEAAQAIPYLKKVIKHEMRRKQSTSPNAIRIVLHRWKKAGKIEQVDGLAKYRQLKKS